MPKPITPLFERMLDRNLNSGNLNSAFYVLRAVIPHMRCAGSGRIIAIGGGSAENPGHGFGAYSASKAALVSLIQTIALEPKILAITANIPSWDHGYSRQPPSHARRRHRAMGATLPRLRP